MPQVQESGHIYFFYRPRVQHASAAGLEEIQRFHVLLNPRDTRKWRMITIGRKRLPELRASGTGERLWAYVAQVAQSPDEVEGELHGYVYPTKTRGLRVQQAARPAGEGTYRLVEHEGHTHLAYALEFPRQIGDVQRELRIAPRGNFVVVVKNPQAPSPPLSALGPAQSTIYPSELQQRFRGRRYAEVVPAFLDRPGAELILIAAHGEALITEEESEIEAESDTAIFRDLRLEPEAQPLNALFEGEWS